MHDILIAIWGLVIHLIAGYLAWRHKTLLAERESHKDRAAYLNSRLDQTCGKLRDVTADLEAQKKQNQLCQSLLDTARNIAGSYAKQVHDLKVELESADGLLKAARADKERQVRELETQLEEARRLIPVRKQKK